MRHNLRHDPGTRDTLCLAGVLSLCVVAWMLPDAVRGYQVKHAIEDRGQPIEGVVVKRFARSTGKRHHFYSLQYTFEVGGETYKNRWRVSSYQHEKHAKGSSIDLLYVPDTPAYNRPVHAEHTGSTEDLVAAVMFSLMGLAGLGMVGIWWTSRSPQREQKK